MVPESLSIGGHSDRPISGPALGGFLLSALYTGLVLISSAVALVKGVPIFYPLWVVLLAMAGFFLCLVGRTQLLASEGTRAGETLARSGMAMALFSGLGYLA